MCHLAESVYLSEPACRNCLSVVVHLFLRCASLYEQDEANVFAEPSVMSAHVLPHLLQLAEKSSQSSALARTLSTWAEENAAQVLDDLAVCEKLQPGITSASYCQYNNLRH